MVLPEIGWIDVACLLGCDPVNHALCVAQWMRAIILYVSPFGVIRCSGFLHVYVEIHVHFEIAVGARVSRYSRSVRKRVAQHSWGIGSDHFVVRCAGCIAKHHCRIHSRNVAHQHQHA